MERVRLRHIFEIFAWNEFGVFCKSPPIIHYKLMDGLEVIRPSIRQKMD